MTGNARNVDDRRKAIGVDVGSSGNDVAIAVLNEAAQVHLCDLVVRIRHRFLGVDVHDLDHETILLYGSADHVAVADLSADVDVRAAVADLDEVTETDLGAEARIRQVASAEGQERDDGGTGHEDLLNVHGVSLPQMRT